MEMKCVARSQDIGAADGVERGDLNSVSWMPAYVASRNRTAAKLVSQVIFQKGGDVEFGKRLEQGDDQGNGSDDESFRRFSPRRF